MPKSCYKFFWKHIYEEIQFHEICKQTVCNFTKDWVKKMIGEGLKSLLCLLDFFYKCLKIWSFQSIFHCWKNVQIRSYFCLCFPVFSPNTGNTDQKWLRIWTLFSQWKILKSMKIVLISLPEINIFSKHAYYNEHFKLVKLGRVHI